MTCVGFTATRTTSARPTAAAASVPTLIPSCSSSTRALSTPRTTPAQRRCRMTGGEQTGHQRLTERADPQHGDAFRCGACVHGAAHEMGLRGAPTFSRHACSRSM